MSIHNRHELAARLGEMGRPLRYDVRSNALRDHQGTAMTDRELSLLIDDSHDGIGEPLPTMRSDKGRRIWEAFMQGAQYDPLEEWFLRSQFLTPLDPANIVFKLWPDRIARPSDDPNLMVVRWGWRAFFCAVVARTLAPPVRWDIVPIILGPQGCGKSTMATNLLPKQWTNGGFPLKGVKDFDAARKTMEFTEGKAILESSEMVGLSTANREVVKAFLSRDTDRATRKYAIQAEDVPRRWCLIGTTNDHRPIPYDASGGRRWIITEVNGMDADDGPRIAQFLRGHRWRYWRWAYMKMTQAQAAGKSFDEMLSLPESLREAHEEHVKRYMWRPARA